MISYMVIINLLLIATICVFIIDISGAADSLKSGIKYVLTKGRMSNSNYRLKPFDCSLCMTFWSSLIYLLVIGQFTLPYIACTCVICCFLGFLKNAILLVEDSLNKIIQLIYKYFIDNENNNL